MKTALCFLSIFIYGFQLASMDQTSSDLKKLIQKIDNNELEQNACQIIPALTDIALHNPGNLIARAYLWTFYANPDKFFTEKMQKDPCSSIKGKALLMAHESQLAPKHLLEFVEENFIEPSVVAAKLSNSKKLYLSYSTIKSNGSLVDRRKRKKNLDDAESIIENYVNILLVYYNLSGSLHAFDILTNHYPKELSRPLTSLIQHHPEIDRENMFARVKSGWLTKVYFGHTGELTNGALEASLAHDNPNQQEEGLLTYLAAALGHEETLRSLVFSAIKSKEDKEIPHHEMEDFFSLLRYAAKITAAPECVLIAGLEILPIAAHQAEALNLLEHFLAAPEANPAVMKEQNYSPLALAQFYLDRNDYDQALDVFLKSWQKGFIPGLILRDNILDATSDVDNLLARLNQANISPSFQLDSFLLAIYRELENFKMAEQSLINLLTKLQTIKSSAELLSYTSIAAEGALSVALAIFISHQGSWHPDTQVLLTIDKLLSTLERMAHETFKGDYYYSRYLINAQLQDREKEATYLKKAADAGHQFAIIFSVQEFYQKSLTDLIHQNNGILKENERQLTILKSGLENNSSSSSSSPSSSSSSSSKMPSSKEIAIDNVQSFIKKWNNIHWKNSNRSELIKDFNKLVLQNPEITSGNSQFLHTNHGRRKNKYGNRASSFEINTLLERAHKFLHRLQN